jgi:phage terminase large subunit-like protein
MTWMMSNVVLKQARSGGPIKMYFPTKERNAAKIDGPVAEIMALSRAIVAVPESHVLFLDW